MPSYSFTPLAGTAEYIVTEARTSKTLATFVLLSGQVMDLTIERKEIERISQALKNVMPGGGGTITLTAYERDETYLYTFRLDHISAFYVPKVIKANT